MQLEITHQFRGSLAAVLDTLTDRDYAHALASSHSFFAEVEVLSLASTRERVSRTVRYRARPFLAQLGPFSPPPAWFVWTEHSELDRAAGLLRFANVPELASVRDKVLNRGTMQFSALACGGVERVARFELELSVARMYAPLVEVALGRIASKLRSSLDEEARILSRWLVAGGCTAEPLSLSA